MPEEYRDRVTKEQFKSRRRNQRMAGEKLGNAGLEDVKSQEFDVDSLDDFNFGMLGAGGAVGRGSQNLDNDDADDDIFGRGKNRFSRLEARKFFESGKYTAQQLYDYGLSREGSNDFIFGNKAKSFLLANGAVVPGTTPPDPVDPEPNDPAPGVPTAPVGGNQTINFPPPSGGSPNPGFGGATQIVQNDNDVVNSFNNNSGTISYNQDNSVSQNVYGGSSRYFNYGGNDIASIYDQDPQSPVGSDRRETAL